MEYVIDVNVPLTAHGAADHLSEDCMLTCRDFLGGFLENDDLLVIDDGLRILEEYQSTMAYEGPDSVGRQFLKWVLTNFANPQRVRMVDIEELADDNYSALPAAFATFDPADKKYLAVALVNGPHTRIVQAADGKWVEWEAEFEEAGIAVEFPCYDELAT